MSTRRTVSPLCLATLARADDQFAPVANDRSWSHFLTRSRCSDRRPARSVCKPARSNRIRLRKALAPDLLRRSEFSECSVSFCAFPFHKAMSGSIRPRPSALTMGGASKRAISSSKQRCLHQRRRLRPPYSLGQETAAQRLSWSFRAGAQIRNIPRGAFRTTRSSPLEHSPRATRGTHRGCRLPRRPSLSPWKTLLRSIVPGCAPRILFQDPAKYCRRRRLRCRFFAQQSPGESYPRRANIFPQIFSELPVAVLGKLVTNSKERGHF